MTRRVLLLFGGRSAEHEISCISARSVMDALDPARYEVVPVGITKDGAWRLLPGGPPALAEGEPMPEVTESSGEEIALSQRRTLAGASDVSVDVVFPVLHGPYGEDGAVQGFLEMAGVAYVGAGVLGSALGMDKGAQKTLLRAAGLPVVDFTVADEHEWAANPKGIAARVRELGLPVFVKPCNLGSSVGITKVTDASGLAAAMDEAFAYDGRVVVEAGVEGAREIECAVLGNEDPQASLPGEIRPSNEFYDYEAKYLDASSELLVPAPLPDEVTERIRALAIEAFRAIACEGMARVDFFLTPQGELWVNELNTIPGFTSISMYPKMWEATGLPYPQLLDRLIELAIERAERRRSKRIEP